MQRYISDWRSKGYSSDIPDEVPYSLMRLGLAPSYKAIAIAILRNDINLLSLGFAPRHSDWYDFLKKDEISKRNNGRGFTYPLF